MYFVKSTSIVSPLAIVPTVNVLVVVWSYVIVAVIRAVPTLE